MSSTNTEPDGQELWDKSAEAWLAQVPKDRNRTVLLDPIMLARAGDGAGREALDVGCGEGRFCRMLFDQGFQVTGLDPTAALIRMAREALGAVAFIQAGAEQMPLDDASFDLVVSYLSLLDIPDLASATAEVVRVLKPGGKFLAANCTPFFTCFDSPWQRDEAGNKLHVRVDNYVDEHAVRAKWCGIDILNYHRSYTQTFAECLKQGLRLEFFEEITPSAEMIAQYPAAADDLRVPNFFVMEWSKT
jgi:ubiquinone/menaquinone biosynthesis C-methylase UbiE